MRVVLLYPLALVAGRTRKSYQSGQYNRKRTPMLVGINKLAANEYLTRRSRANNDLFEEFQSGSLERECVEEICVYEEVSEAFEGKDNYQAKIFWRQTTNRCRYDASENLCNPKNTRKCLNKWNSKICICRTGWTGNTCNVDENECNSDNSKQICESLGEHFRCVNSEGGYACACKQGYEEVKDEETGSRKCVNINECLDAKASSGHNCEQVCVDTPGSFVCGCKPGFKLQKNGKNCRDVDECKRGMKEGKKPKCDDSNSSCKNTLGDYECNCKSGFKHRYGTTKKCKDINECELGDKCTSNGECENNPGGYKCNCHNGYKNLNKNPTGKCIDVNECADSNAGCQHYCRNVGGSFACSCQDGYQLLSDNKSCGDVNECQNPGACGANEQCKNVKAGFICVCRPGYRKGPGGVCADINECLSRKQNPCSRGRFCLNTEGSYKCVSCEKGEKMVDGKCVDIDECSYKNGRCTGGCVNTNGSYHCTCDNGYEVGPNKHSCVNIDECSLGDTKSSSTDSIIASQTCSGHSSKCFDTPGSFKCACLDQGYQLTNKTVCVDRNECHYANKYSCPEFTKCVNTVGSYECDCITGYVKNGGDCSADPYLLEVSTGCPIDNKCEQGCRVREKLGDDGTGHDCFCWGGYALSIDGYSCLRDYELDLHVPSVENDSSDDCPFGFIKIGGNLPYGRPKCYFLGEEKVTFDEAFEKCEAKGYELAEIEDKEQNHFLGLATGEYDVFWMGYLFNNESSVFEWPETRIQEFNDRNSNNMFNSWYLDVPTNGTDDLYQEFCVVSNWGDVGKWMNIPCNYPEAKYACSTEVSRSGFRIVDSFKKKYGKND